MKKLTMNKKNKMKISLYIKNRYLIPNNKELDHFFSKNEDYIIKAKLILAGKVMFKKHNDKRFCEIFNTEEGFWLYLQKFVSYEEVKNNFANLESDYKSYLKNNLVKDSNQERLDMLYKLFHQVISKNPNLSYPRHLWHF